MKTATLLSVLAFLTSTVNASSSPPLTPLPRAEPTPTRDPWQCATENITQYFDVPKPTSALLTALQSYGDLLIASASCTPTPLATTPPSCPFPPKSLWCGFTTAAPSTVLPAYSAYGSVAAEWWTAHSSAVGEVKQECPVRWAKEVMETPGGDAWLNGVVAFAGCYDDARMTGGSSTGAAAGTTTGGMAATMTGGTAATGISGTTGGGSTTTPTQTQTPTQTKTPNGVCGRVEGIEMWMVAGAGLAAVAMNLVW